MERYLCKLLQFVIYVMLCYVDLMELFAVYFDIICFLPVVLCHVPSHRFNYQLILLSD